jgi:DtxR family transcriptional regulator, Mn-dependent transcriptional regulator
MAAEHATVAEEEYLERLFWLYEAGLPMTGANMARAMQLSAPTVHEMLGRLERDGYIMRTPDRAIDFTESGREHAEHIVSRHRMIERFLTDVVGVPWDDVHEEAEQLEHAMTPRFEAYVRATVVRSRSASGSTACPWPIASRAPRSRSCGSRTRPRTSCTTSRRPGSIPE